MFLNDIEEFLLTKDIIGLKSITDELETELEIYLKIFKFYMPMTQFY